MPTFVSLFAGVGGCDRGLEAVGWTCAGQVELDPFCRRVLAARWPGVPRRGDIRGIGAQSLHAIAAEHLGREREAARGIDLLCAGFPCQDFSVAGKRAGLDGYQGTLFWEIVRIAKILRPTWGLFENVPGLLSSHRGRDFWAVLTGLRECWPAVGWRVLDSQYFGVPQRRRRVFLVGGPSVETVRAVLFEPEGGRGDLAASGEARAGLAGPLGGGAYGTGRRDEDDPNVIVACPLTASMAKRHDEDTDTLVVGALGCDKAKGGWRSGPDEAHAGQLIIGQCHGSNVGPMGALRQGDGGVTSGVPFVTHSLRAAGADGSEDGTGRGTPLVAIPLDLRNASRTTDRSKQNRQGLGVGEDGDPSPSLTDVFVPGIATANLVRRLTPLECERLQAFPDGFTCLDVPLEDYATDPERASERCRCPDSPRYRAIGNAVTVSVVEWLARRLRMALAERQR